MSLQKEIQPHKERIAKWADFDVTEEWQNLGSGTQGTAWRAGDKVLKVTRDREETNNAALLKEHPHPNIYTIRRVARFLPLQNYLIVYDYLPTSNDELASFVDQIDAEHLVSKLTDYKLHDGQIRGFAKDLLEATNWAVTLGQRPTAADVIDQLLQELPIHWLISLAVTIKFNKQRSLYKLLDIDRWREELQKLSQGHMSKEIEWLQQLSSAMKHLKSLGIVFDDVYADNVMESWDGQAVLIDIGFAKSNRQGDIEIFESVCEEHNE